MRKDESKLLDSLVGTQLPSTRDTGTPPAVPSPEPEPTEPADSYQITVRTRTPEDVVPGADLRTDPDDGQPPAATDDKEIKKAKIRSGELSVEDIKNDAELLKDLIATYRQFPGIQKKYIEALEKLEGKQPATTQPAQPAAQPRQITDADIARVYDPFAERAIAALIEQKLIEDDLADAYPRALRTMVGQLRYAFDILNEMKPMLDRVVEILNQDATRRQREERFAVLNQRIDSLVASGAKGKKNPYEALKNPSVRQGFLQFLRDLNPPASKVVGDGAEDFLARQWIAYNHEAIIEATKIQGDGKKGGANPKAAGEGGGARANGGGPEPEPKGRADGLLDRLVETRLPPQ